MVVWRKRLHTASGKIIKYGVQTARRGDRYLRGNTLRCCFLLVLLLSSIVFSACSKQKTEPTAPAVTSEGVDTSIRITDYTSFRTVAEANCYLSEGDKVAVLAPSALPGKQKVEETMEGLRRWGYEPVEGRYVSVEERTLADCVEDLKWALSDPEIKAIVCVRGGHASSEVLDVLPLDLIRSAGKPIIGYSDISAYHSAWTVAGLPSFHCSMRDSLAGNYPDDCIEAVRNMIKGNIPSYECQGSRYDIPGAAEGVLIGGNLATLMTVLDTPYDSTRPDTPYILFLEDVGETYEGIHRYLTVLDHQGVLDNAQGIIFGEFVDRPMECDTYSGNSRGGEFDSVADMVSREFLTGRAIPVAFGFPAGHGAVNYPLLMGAWLKLDVREDSFKMEWTVEHGKQQGIPAEN